jgi:hypothetical protein
MDRFGSDCEAYTAVGDKTVNQNVIRGDFHMHTKRTHTAPSLEACSVSRLMGLQDEADGQIRPADVLLCRAQDVQTGMGVVDGKVASEIGIILCPQAMGHLGSTACEFLGAAEEYGKTKCTRGHIERSVRKLWSSFRQ